MFDRDLTVDIGTLALHLTWGTSPDQVVPAGGRVPHPSDAPDAATATAWQRALDYTGLRAGQDLADVAVQRVFIGSCTNSRLDDLRSAAAVVRGRHLADGVHGMVVPGSGLVCSAAEHEGLHRVFIDGRRSRPVRRRLLQDRRPHRCGDPFRLVLIRHGTEHPPRMGSGSPALRPLGQQRLKTTVRGRTTTQHRGPPGDGSGHEPNG